MSQTEEDWTTFLNKRYGWGITRPNTEIFTPIIQLFTFPKQLYTDGTVNPPEAVYVADKFDLEGNYEPLPEQTAAMVTWEEAYADITGNPNFVDGNYWPDYLKNSVSFEKPLPEGLNKAPQKDLPRYSLDVRRHTYFY